MGIDEARHADHAAPVDHLGARRVDVGADRDDGAIADVDAPLAKSPSPRPWSARWRRGSRYRRAPAGVPRARTGPQDPSAGNRWRPTQRRPRERCGGSNDGSSLGLSSPENARSGSRSRWLSAYPFSGVTRGLDPRVHTLRNSILRRRWIPGHHCGTDDLLVVTHQCAHAAPLAGCSRPWCCNSRCRRCSTTSRARRARLTRSLTERTRFARPR